MTLNINLGGYKGFKNFPPEIIAKWKVLDIDPKCDYPHDLNSLNPLMFEDNEVDAYYASMILEHIYPCNLDHVFREVRRTLKPNGLIRIVVPDIEKGMKAYFQGNIRWLSNSKRPTPDSDFPPTLLGKLMGWFYTEDVDKKGAMRSGHNMVFDFDTMKYYLEKNGFRNIKRKSFNVCSEVFKGKDFPRYINFGLYVEATNEKDMVQRQDIERDRSEVIGL